MSGKIERPQKKGQKNFWVMTQKYRGAADPLATPL